MRALYGICMLLLLGSALGDQVPRSGPRSRAKKVSLESQQWIQKYAEAWAHLEERAEKNATWAKLLQNHFDKYNQDVEESLLVDYECDLPPSRFPPTNAHQVRPSDINAVGAVGDSITAGFGITAESIIQMLRNDRHQAFASGGIRSLQDGMITIPNILKKFNPALSGYSYGESWPSDPEAGLNVAVGGEIASGMYDNMYDLVDKMWYEGSNIGVDWYEDWKLISFLIGGNDLCRFCDDEDYYSADAYVNNIRRALDYLMNEGPPNVIVVLSTIFDITPLPAFSDDLVCDFIQGFVCGCATDDYYHPMIQKAQRDYHQGLVNLIESGRYDREDRRDFTVILAPHFKNAQPPKEPGTDNVDRSFWAVDCFHPGRKAHYAIATSLWNQLFYPEGTRPENLDWNLGQNLICPVESAPFIQTRLNGPPPKKGTSGLKFELMAEAMSVDEGQPEAGDNRAVIGGSIGGVLAICVVVGAVVGVRTYKKRKAEDQRPLPMDNLPNIDTPSA